MVEGVSRVEGQREYVARGRAGGNTEARKPRNKEAGKQGHEVRKPGKQGNREIRRYGHQGSRETRKQVLRNADTKRQRD